jgi:hypothetical protein
MELKSFRELLLKKATDNPTLQTIIDVMKDDLIADKVIESLKKMALKKPHENMGLKANAGVTSFGRNLTNKDIRMMRDAIGHHIAHHKAALKAGDRDAADKHLEKIMPLMYLAHQAANHSNGMMTVEAEEPQSWESNITTEERSPKGRRVEETEGWARRAKPNSKRIYTPKNYRYLEMPPHPEHDHSKTRAGRFNDSGYPFEEIQIGSPADVNAKRAYLHIPDIENKSGFTPHPFDEHPIHDVVDLGQPKFIESNSRLGGKSYADQYVENIGNWLDSEHNKKWHSTVSPEGVKLSRSDKPTHHFNGLKLDTLPHHTKTDLPATLREKLTTQSAAEPIQAKPSQTFNPTDLPPALKEKYSK